LHHCLATVWVSIASPAYHHHHGRIQHTYLVQQIPPYTSIDDACIQMTSSIRRKRRRRSCCRRDQSVTAMSMTIVMSQSEEDKRGAKVTYPCVIKVFAAFYCAMLYSTVMMYALTRRTHFPASGTWIDRSLAKYRLQVTHSYRHRLSSEIRFSSLLSFDH
jgi:hypothetical protein